MSFYEKNEDYVKLVPLNMNYILETQELKLGMTKLTGYKPVESWSARLSLYKEKLKQHLVHAPMTIRPHYMLNTGILSSKLQLKLLQSQQLKQLFGAPRKMHMTRY